MVPFNLRPLAEPLPRDLGNRFGLVLLGLVISGRNRGKIDYINTAVGAGYHALVDKPWVLRSEDLPKLNADRMHAFYQQLFANAADFTFFFVGAFKVDEITPLLEKYVASLPSTGTSTCSCTRSAAARRSTTR